MVKRAVLLLLLQVLGVLAHWHLAMNLNPSDYHVMKYCSKWDKDVPHGSQDEALKADYISAEVRKIKIRYIAIVRHDAGRPNAVKIWELQRKDTTLLALFQDAATEPIEASTGDHIYIEVLDDAKYIERDVIFSKRLGGKLMVNSIIKNKGHRIVIPGGQNEDSIGGIGNSNIKIQSLSSVCAGNGQDNECYHEVGLLQNCSSPCSLIVYTGHDADKISGFCKSNKMLPKDGDYAIYVSNSLQDKPFPPLKSLQLSTKIFITGNF